MSRNSPELCAIDERVLVSSLQTGDMVFGCWTRKLEPHERRHGGCSTHIRMPQTWKHALHNTLSDSFFCMLVQGLRGLQRREFTPLRDRNDSVSIDRRSTTHCPFSRD